MQRRFFTMWIVMMLAGHVGAETVVFCGKGTAGEYWQLMAAGVQVRADALGWTVLDASPELATQADVQRVKLEAALLTQPDAVIVAPIDRTNLVDLLNTAYTAGVKIILLDEADTTQYHAKRVYSEAGLLAAQTTAKTKHGNAVEINANPQNVQALKAGTLDALVQRDPWAVGYDAVGLVVDLLKGKSVTADAEMEPVILTANDLKTTGKGAKLFKKNRTAP